MDLFFFSFLTNVGGAIKMAAPPTVLANVYFYVNTVLPWSVFYVNHLLLIVLSYR